MTGEYSVVQFFDSTHHELVRRDVSAGEAFVAATVYTNNVAANAGLTAKVIIIDGGDHIVFQWERGKGITFPPQHRDSTA